jgi:hypothetical protein
VTTSTHSSAQDTTSDSRASDGDNKFRTKLFQGLLRGMKTAEKNLYRLGAYLHKVIEWACGKGQLCLMDLDRMAFQFAYSGVLTTLETNPAT